MSEKTNKWFRLFDDIFVQGNNYKNMFGYEGNTGNKKTHILVGGSYKMISIEGYTPQDLIEVGDLVFKKQKVSLYCKGERAFIVEDVFDDGRIVYSSLDDGETMSAISINQITKILTPNSNGGYDLKWSADNDKR